MSVALFLNHFKREIIMNLQIQAIPAFKDNYLWLIINPDLPEALVVDPGDATPVLEALGSKSL